MKCPKCNQDLIKINDNKYRRSWDCRECHLMVIEFKLKI